MSRVDRFGFNGKENDDEWNGQTGSTYDFGARLYDARIGRWMACDPLARKYPSLSAYHFANNSPIITIDPNGKENVIVVGHETTNGQSTVYREAFLMGAVNEAERLGSQGNGEKTVIIVYHSEYTQEQIDRYASEAKLAGAELIPMEKRSDVIDYINNRPCVEITLPDQSTTTTTDKITDFVFIGHGWTGGIHLGPKGNELITTSNIINGEIDANAFTKNSVAMIISCQSATEPDNQKYKGKTVAGLFASKITNQAIGAKAYSYWLGGGKYTWGKYTGYNIYNKNGLEKESTAKFSQDVIESQDTGTELYEEKD